VTLAYQTKEKKKRKKRNNYKLKMDQLTNGRLKTSRLHWGRTYIAMAHRINVHLLNVLAAFRSVHDNNLKTTRGSR